MIATRRSRTILVFIAIHPARDKLQVILDH